MNIFLREGKFYSPWANWPGWNREFKKSDATNCTRINCIIKFSTWLIREAETLKKLDVSGINKTSELNFFVILTFRLIQMVSWLFTVLKSHFGHVLSNFFSLSVSALKIRMDNWLGYQKRCRRNMTEVSWRVKLVGARATCAVHGWCVTWFDREGKMWSREGCEDSARE